MPLLSLNNSVKGHKLKGIDEGQARRLITQTRGSRTAKAIVE
jgi:hypothetical protein